MADLVELQKQLNNIDELLALLVNLSDERIPQLKNDINEIVKNIKGGFDKEELARQIRAVLNQAINESDYTKLKANIDATARKMIDAVESSSRKVEHWQDNYQLRSRWHYALISGAICFVLGAGLMWSWQYKRIDKYQYAIDQTNAMSAYINSDCDIKKSYAKFVGDTITCDKNWLSPTVILENK